jgi:surfactin synthase thioesterase subunit
VTAGELQLVGNHLTVPRPGAGLRLLVFHHAGGSATSFLPVAQALPEVESCLFELAGRGMRAEEPPAADYRAAVAELRPEVTGLIDRPTLLLGHSLGALIAHSLIAGLPADRRALVRGMLVSSSQSPATAAADATHPPAPFVSRDREGLLAELHGRGGSPPELFEDDELVDYAVRLIGHDLHLADTYVAPPEPVEGVPYRIWYGRDDPYLDRDEAERWAPALGLEPEIRAFRGGHFYLGQRPEPRAALQELVAAIAL